MFAELTPWFTTQHVVIGIVISAFLFPTISHVIRVLSSPIALFVLSPLVLLFILLSFIAANVTLGLLLDYFRSSQSRSGSRYTNARYRNGLVLAARPLRFTTPAAWQAVLIRSQWSATSPLNLPPLVSSLPTLSGGLNQVITLIVRDFVLTWYKPISTSPSFPGAVSQTIHSALANILNRLNKLDLPSLVVKRIVPKITAHIDQFRQGEMAVRGAGLERHLTQSDELDMLLASRYAAQEATGRLHPAVANLSSMVTKQTEEIHLRGIIDTILPLVLPEQEGSSRAVHIVAREIVSCIVLVEVMELLSDPDVWNRAIDEAAGAVIRQQKLISKVRSILDTDTSTPTGPLKPSTEDITSRTGIRHFELFLKSINRTDSLLDARRLKNDITNEIRKTRLLLANHEKDDWINGERAGDVVAYLDRLYTAKKKVEKRIGLLGGKADDSRHSVLLDHSPGGQGRHTLREVLSNPSSLSYFMEFMDRRNRSIMVQFWLHVESFKNPLESVESGEESGDEDKLQGPGVNAVSTTVKEDMKGIYEMYFSSSPSTTTTSKGSTLSSLVQVVTPKHISTIREFARDIDTPTVRQERRVRRSVLLAQRQVEKEMEEDFLEFERSELWFKAVGDMQPSSSKGGLPPPLTTSLSTIEEGPTSILKNKTRGGSGLHPTFAVPPLERSESAPVRPSISWDSELSSGPSRNLAKAPTNLDLLLGAEEDGEENTGKKEDRRTPLFDSEKEEMERMEAIQAALTDIIADENRYSESPDAEHGHGGEEREEEEEDDLMGRQEGDGRRKMMFDDVHDVEEEEEGDDDDDETNNTNNSFEPALPGDLQLSYDIARLTDKILKLQSQQTILETLIRKAELTGDAQELRLLNKSKSAMDRELRALTFQRAQYEEQEAENRLVPDRTRVAIRNMNTAEEDGKPVVRYLIEVQQLAVDGTFASGWIVARRYNEFFLMHQRLREKYVAVRGLDFPGKRLVTSLSSSFVDTRRVGLEKYMQNLIGIRLVCESDELRSFLSRKSPMTAIQPPPTTSPSSTLFSSDATGIVRTMYRSVTESIDDIFFGPSMLDVMIQRLTRQAAEFAGIAGSSVNDEDVVAQALATASASSPTGGLEKMALPGDLKPLEGESGASSFSGPICDLILAVFELDKKNNWLRRQAIVIILQQVLGGTIERKLREVFKSNTDEIHLMNYLGLFRNALWPGGNLKPPSIPRTMDEKARTREEANKKLTTLMPDLAANMIGRSNARRGARRMFAVLQNRRLNQHLAYTVFDEVIAALFPEAVFNPT